jgi:hypothetical protein
MCSAAPRTRGCVIRNWRPGWWGPAADLSCSSRCHLVPDLRGSSCLRIVRRRRFPRTRWPTVPTCTRSSARTSRTR